MAGRIPTKEVVGISTFTAKDGRTGYNIYLLEPFRTDEEAQGMKTATEFTYEDFGLKVGDRVKIYKDVVNSRNGAFGVIADIEVIGGK